jgi:hypothetical protein
MAEEGLSARTHSREGRYSNAGWLGLESHHTTPARGVSARRETPGSFTIVTGHGSVTQLLNLPAHVNTVKPHHGDDDDRPNAVDGTQTIRFLITVAR